MLVHQCWDLFGLPQGASREHVRSRYRKLVRRWHPDKFADDDTHRKAAEEQMKLINEAYRVLTETRETFAPPAPPPPPKAVNDSAIRWLQSEFVLTYLPLVVVLLFSKAPVLAGLLFVIAGSMMAAMVWRNEALSPGARFGWIMAMIVFAAIAVPIYFARYGPRSAVC